MTYREWNILPGYAREEEIRQLFTEYTNMVLAGDPAFAEYLAQQHYEEELAHPARKYAPPHGRLYLVCMGSTPVGCIALKALDDTRCEMKRLYVRPEYRGQGIARALARHAEKRLAARGVGCLYLTADDAIPFWQQLGYRRTGRINEKNELEELEKPL